MSGLDGELAVVTGGTGLAVARRFVEAGAYVFVTGRLRSELDKSKALLGENVAVVRGDATSTADLDHLVERVLREKGTLDVPVANSGRVEPEEFGEITEENFDIDLNARAALFTARKALPLVFGLEKVEAWELVESRWPHSPAYRAKAGREIPILVLEPTAPGAS
jgi:NAD(P)-dependent dehydrogenase (short-subunit alcohol dehydrogenase family)